jgi:tetratricopeptide (TPR) repeat protein
MPFDVFISYAHKDRKLRDELAVHLGNLRHQQVISDWFDGDIIPGTAWEQEILEHLRTAKIILLLISAHFMASSFCWDIEMKEAIARHEAKQARVIPILLRPTDWKDAPFAKLQALPSLGKPVSRWPTHDDAFEDVIKGIRRAIEDLHASASPKPLASPSSAPGTNSISGGQLSVWNVPFRRNPFFTGREAVFTQIHTLLHAGKSAALSQPPAISGLGGIGKTQTAVEYAYRYRDAYQFVLWVQANTSETLLSNFVALAGLLKLPEQDAQEQQLVVQAVHHWFETHSGWLLIFDNADDLSTIHNYLPEGNMGHTLLTTRAQAMGGLARKIELDTMGPEEGAALLLRRAGVIAHDALLDSASTADRALAREIVHAMDGLPLALDQAGAYLEETQESLSNYLTIYQQQRAALLKRRGGLLPHHPDSVATTWSLAFEHVERENPAAIELMRLCAFLAPDAIPEELIQEGAPHLGPVLHPVAADRSRLNAALAALLNYSLLRRDATTHTLSLHRLVQAVILDEMDEETQQHWAERAVRAVEQVFPYDEPPPWPRSQRYLPHALACEALIKQWDITFAEAAALLNNAGVYLRVRGQYQEAEPLLQEALAIGEKQYGINHPDTAYLLNNLANLYWNRGKYDEAEALYQRALAIREKALGPEHPKTAHTLHNLASLYSKQGKYDEAEALYQRALAIREKGLGPEHPDTVRVKENYSNLLQQIKRRQEQQGQK